MIFVIQEHNAWRAGHHFDLRLESNGTLLSWVLRKIPPTTVGEKRLAIQVGDHSLEYATFEGIIESGSYGAGSVSLWDQGELKWIVPQNHRFFHLRGKKIHGVYTITPFHNDFLFYKIIEGEIGFTTY